MSRKKKSHLPGFISHNLCLGFGFPLLALAQLTPMPYSHTDHLRALLRFREVSSPTEVG